MKRNYNKAARNYLLKNKDTLLNAIIFLVLSIPATFLVQSDMLATRGENYQLYLMYLLILGISFIQGSSMVVDLTVKDRLSRRLEFYLASGGDVKEILKAYTLEMFRIAAIIPFFIFMACFYMIDWTVPFEKMILIYVTTSAVSYLGIYLLNTLVLSIKRFKLFKNILFFSNFLIFFIGTNLGPSLLDSNIFNILSLDTAILFFNLIIGVVLLMITLAKIKHVNNEDIIRRDALWE
ncbi:hypothetical protein SAMN02745245_01964 [Anaerosphaera aminiphila DSM 21120]|uniref:ABC-2 family transporter protein n=1 Tax=Anaerosphaera aminiphila DSM 21120 TaxID=1120995 RepID=A0A1M5V388_9FIRM|nr:hypothetical protein [Anaerosphaera aminiphila]SHH69719.1 hypothetical protein SAMN02745245_01964 [Anaerosphaera aminiphila DSM 21120]